MEGRLSVAGIRLTSENCNNISNFNGVSGRVSYDSSTQTLTLDNATITATGEYGYGINNWIDGLTIKLIGSNTITAYDEDGIYNAENCTLTIKGVTSDATLTVKSLGGQACKGIYSSRVSIINVKDCSLIVSGVWGGIVGGNWYFVNCTVCAKGGINEETYSSCNSLLSVGFDNCASPLPTGAYWKESQWNGLTLHTLFGADDKAIKDWVTIAEPTGDTNDSGYTGGSDNASEADNTSESDNTHTPERYGILIAGTEVTDENYNDISNFSGVSGKITFDPGFRTLILDNVTIATGESEGVCIHTDIEGLRIQLIGKNTLIMRGEKAALKIYDSTNITGNGTLDILSNGCAIYICKSDLWISDCVVNAVGKNEGIIGDPSGTSTLSIDISELMIEGKKKRSLGDLKNIKLDGICIVIQPLSGLNNYYNPSTNSIELNGADIKDKIEITYDWQTQHEINQARQRHEDINEGLRGIQHNAYALLNSDMYNDKESYPEAIEDASDRNFAYILDKRQSSFSEKEIYVRGSGYENIYPGAILFVDSDITSGSPNPLGRIPRSKISIYGDFLAGGNPSQSDINPNNSDVRMAINNIMHILLNDSRYDAPGAQRPRTKIHTSQKSLMMDLGVDSSFAGCNVNVRASATSSEQSFIQATTLDQDYFTIRLKDDWHQDPASLFADSVTWNDLSRELNGKAIAIVTSVTYGRTFSYMKEYSARQFTFDSSQKVSGYGQSASASQSLAESSSYTNDEIFNLGGTSLTISALRGKNTQHELEEAMADNMRFSHANQGVITKYTLQLITGPTPGTVVRPLYSGTQYQIGYTKCPRRLFAHIDVSRVHIGPGKVKVQLDVECFRIGKEGEQKGKILPTKKVNGGSPDGAQKPWFYTFSHSQNREYGDLQPGEYINKGPLLRIRSKRGGGSYEAQTEKRLSPKEMETGALNISLSGSVYDSVKIRDLEPFNP